MTRQLPVGYKYTCLVDDDTYIWAQNLTWGFYGRPNYAVGHRIRYGGKIAILRRLVVGALPGERVRNKNGDWLDCRWENLPAWLDEAKAHARPIWMTVHRFIDRAGFSSKRLSATGICAFLADWIEEHE